MGRKAAGGTLYAPGERKGSGSFIWRGRIAGELVEVSTRTTSRRDAIAFLRDFIPAKREQLLAERGRARQGAPRTFAAVAMAYAARSEEHTSEPQSLMRTSYAVFCLKQKKKCTRSTSK